MVIFYYNVGMSFSENLREAMRVTDTTTKELSAITGIKEETISSYLKTKGAIPNAEKAVRIAEVLGTSVEFLVTGFEKATQTSTYDIHRTNRYSSLINALEKLPEESRAPILRMISEMGKKFSKD